ncbi:S-layer homology domain-containing protein [Paenibacillus larvae]|uniref:S-layer homology domain-containing protein n=1 Tax=Paenibacillus larvae TaxID=1464 RepID=UPI0009AE2444|nr:S-layer homology domain-containing protein [Paenibacillus larvae]AQZ47073.1 hypothetical protein B5S25_11230 [Paenibacillus larvae subsp. pulvifaciens]
MRNMGSIISNDTQNEKQFRGGEKKVMKKSLSVIVSSAMALSMFSSVAFGANIDDFKDLKDLSAKDKAKFEEMINKGILHGLSDNYFGLDELTNRAQFARVAAGVFDLKVDTSLDKSSFSDVSKDDPANGYALPYIEAAKENNIASGYEDGTYRPAAALTKEELATLLVKGAGLKDEAEKAKGNDPTVSDWAQGYVKVAVDHELMVNDSDGRFHGSNPVNRYMLVVSTYNVMKKDEDLALSSVQAVSTKVLRVNFNTAVKEMDKAEFAVKKGSSTIGVDKTTWSEDGKSVDLEINSKLTEGTYTVSVKGLSEQALSGSVTVENEKVSAIKILSDNLVKTGKKDGDKDIAEVGYQVLNQYGEDITKATSLEVVQEGFAADKGKLNYKKKDLKEGDKVVVTLVDKKTAVNTSATLTVVAESKVVDVTAAGIYNKDGKTPSLDNTADDFYVLVDAKDQYGKTITDEKKLSNEITVLATKGNVVDIKKDNGIPKFEKVGDEGKVGVKLDVKNAGEGLIMFVANATGANSNQLVKVAEGVKVDKITIGSPEGIIAGNEIVNIPVEVTDNKGEAVTKADKLKDIAIGAEGGKKNQKFVEKDGKLFIQLTTKEVKEGETGNLIVSVTSPTGKYSYKVFQIKADAVATTLVGLNSKVSTSIYKDESLKLDKEDFIIEDQYGRPYTKEDATTIMAKSSDNEKIAVNGLTITAKKESALVTFTLNAGKSNESSFDVRFNTIAQSDFVSYKVPEVGTVYASAEAAYDKDLKVYGVTKEGKEVLLPEKEYNVVEKQNFVVKDNKISAEQNVVGGSDKPSTADAFVKIVINNTGEELVLKGKISAEAPKASTVEYLVDNKVVDSADVTINTNNLTPADLLQGLHIKDQYGVDAKVDGKDSKLVVTFADKTTKDALVTFTNVSDGVTIQSNGTETASLSKLKNGSTFNARISVNDVSANVKFKVNYDASKAIEQAKKALKEAQQEQETAQTELTNAEQSVTTAQTKLTDANQKLAAAAEALKHADDSNRDDLTQKFQAAQEEQETAQTELTNAEQAVTTAQTKLTEANQKVTEAEQALIDLQG